MRACSKCGEEKPLTEFYREAQRHRADCKLCSRERRKTYYHANRDEERSRHSEWKARNPDYFRRWAEANADSVKEKARNYYLDNIGRYRENTRRWRSENPEAARRIAREGYYRRSQSPHYRLDHAISACVYRSLRSSKGDRPTFELLGYSLEELIAHLERQFRSGMTWANYGEWHVDHILPLSSFNYATPDDPDFRAAWALTNLRPMWGDQNISKGAKRLTLL